MSRTFALVMGVVALVATAAPRAADACSIPVFRYALERWKPSAYEAVIFHRGPLADAEQLAVTALTDVAGGSVNLDVTKIDLSVADAAGQRLWERQKASSLPWLSVRVPEAAAGDPPLYAGPLEKASARVLVDSPARQEVAKRLLKGESAVWVLLESGVAERDTAAAKLLEDRLAILHKQLRLPDQPAVGDEADPVPEEPRLRSKLPLNLRFSILRVSPRDAAESGFADLLRRVEASTAKLPPGEPPPVIAVPVFGQGRALCGLSGRHLTAEAIDDCAAFLVGACSCQVKELNPGTDLLMAADWDSIFEGESAPEPKTKIPEPVIGSGKPKRAAPSPPPKVPQP